MADKILEKRCFFVTALHGQIFRKAFCSGLLRRQDTQRFQAVAQAVEEPRGGLHDRRGIHVEFLVGELPGQQRFDLVEQKCFGSKLQFIHDGLLTFAFGVQEKDMFRVSHNYAGCKFMPENNVGDGIELFFVRDNEVQKDHSGSGVW